MISGQGVAALRQVDRPGLLMHPGGRPVEESDK